MRALGRNVLGELGQEFQRVEDLEIPAGAPCQFVVLRVREGPASILLGFVALIGPLRVFGCWPLAEAPRFGASMVLDRR
jgi:hypothetical protein